MFSNLNRDYTKTSDIQRLILDPEGSPEKREKLKKYFKWLEEPVYSTPPPQSQPRKSDFSFSFNPLLFFPFMPPPGKIS